MQLQQTTDLVDAYLRSGYESIQQARLERLKLGSDPCLCLHDDQPHYLSPPRRRKNNSKNNFTLSPTTSSTGDDDDVYEDDPDWVDLHDMAIQDLHARTEHLEQQLLDQQVQHTHEMKKLQTVVQTLQTQATLSAQRWQETPPPLHQSPPQPQPQPQHNRAEDPPLLSQHFQHAQYNQLAAPPVGRRPQHPTQPTQPTPQQQHPPHPPPSSTAAEYENKINQLEEHLRDMSNKVSSHELQVVTDSSAVLTDMSLKLGEHMGENKYLKNRLNELNKEVQDIRKQQQQQQQQQQPSTPAQRPPAPASPPSPPSSPTPTPEHRSVDNRQTPKTIAAAKPKKTQSKTNPTLLMVQNVPIDGRIKLASKLRKLERIALELLSSSSGNTSSGRGRSRKKNKIHNR